MTRAERKKEAQKKINQTILEINECFIEAFKKTRDWKTAVGLTEKYVNKQMNENPQETHIWERAVVEWQDKFVGVIKEKLNENKRNNKDD